MCGLLPAAAGQANPTIEAPDPVSAVFYNSGFALYGVSAVEILEKEGRTYAIATSEGNDGVQIIDITDPTHPVPVSAAFDGSGGFSALDRARDVGIFEREGRTYAIVASEGDDGAQIMDITDPTHPVPVSAVFDGSGGFTALDGANDIEILEREGRTYAIVAAVGGDGAQIMDITDPTHPVPVSAVFDSSDGFTALDGAYDVEIFEREGRTYAIVASWRDYGVQIMDITPPVAHPLVFGGGFYTNLDAIIEVTDYQRTEYGDNSLIQMTARITNQEDIVIMGPNHQNNYRDGEVLVFLGGTMPPPSKGTEYRNSFGFGDKSYQWLRANGADVSEKDCTSEGGWSDIKPAETGVERLCFWVPSNFTPDGLFVAVYDVLDGEMTTDLYDVIIRAQIVPFTIDSAYCSDHTDICNTDGLQNIASDTNTDPHPPYVTYVDPALIARTSQLNATEPSGLPTNGIHTLSQSGIAAASIDFDSPIKFHNFAVTLSCNNNPVDITDMAVVVADWQERFAFFAKLDLTFLDGHDDNIPDLEIGFGDGGVIGHITYPISLSSADLMVSGTLWDASAIHVLISYDTVAGGSCRLAN